MTLHIPADQAPKMDWEAEDKLTAFKWYKDKLKLFFEANQIAKERQYAFILLNSGDEGLRRFNTLKIAEKDKENPENVWAGLASTMEVSLSHWHYIDQMYSFQRQKKNETTDEFALRIEELVKQAGFEGNDADRRHLELLFHGTRHPAVKFFCRKKKVAERSYAEILKYSKEHERTAIETEGYPGHSKDHPIVVIDHVGAGKRNCTKCGTWHTPRNCPAYGQACKKCQGKNHWAKMCRSTKSSKPPKRRHSRSRSRSPSRDGRKTYGGSTPGRHHKSFNKYKKGKGSKQHSVHSVQVEETPEYQGYNSDDFTPLTFCSVEVERKPSKAPKRRPSKVPVDACDVIDDLPTDSTGRREIHTLLAVKLSQFNKPSRMKVKVDGGAGANMLPVRVYRQMFPQNLNAEGNPKKGVLRPHKVTFTCYDSERVYVYGACTLQIRANTPAREYQDHSFFVVESERDILIGHPSSERLRLVAVLCENMAEVVARIDGVVKESPGKKRTRRYITLPSCKQIPPAEAEIQPEVTQKKSLSGPPHPPKEIRGRSARKSSEESIAVSESGPESRPETPEPPPERPPHPPKEQQIKAKQVKPRDNAARGKAKTPVERKSSPAGVPRDGQRGPPTRGDETAAEENPCKTIHPPCTQFISLEEAKSRKFEFTEKTPKGKELHVPKPADYPTRIIANPVEVIKYHLERLQREARESKKKEPPEKQSKVHKKSTRKEAKRKRQETKKDPPPKGSRYNPVYVKPGSVKINSVEDLKALYPNSFDCIGDMKGEYDIKLDPNVHPVQHARRKVPLEYKEEIEAELMEMKRLGIITEQVEPTPWVSSLTYPKKANGKLRVCLDPKDLNRAIIRENHKAPTLEEISHQLARAKHFTKVDGNKAFFGLWLSLKSSLLTTFNTHLGRFRFLRVPFGLKMSQDIYQMRMDHITVLCPGVIAIHDDIFIYGETEEEHDMHLINLMNVAQKEGLVFNSAKCVVKGEKITFFGAVFSAKGMYLDPEKVQAIRELSAPTTKQELQTFLGCVNYLQCFVPHLSTHTDPLRQMLKKENIFAWDEGCNSSFQKVKALLVKALEKPLAYFDRNKPVTVQADASIKGLGAALLQDGHPIAFGSKSLTETEQRYANIERELLAIVYACEKFHTYLYGRPFVAESDHRPLEMISLKNLVAAPPRLQRMLLRLQQYDIAIKYKPGKEMTLADCLSRLPSKEDQHEIELDLRVDHLQLAAFSPSRISKLAQETEADPTLSTVMRLVINGFPEQRRHMPRITRQYWDFRDELSTFEGCLLKGERVVVPPSCRDGILADLHGHHAGVKKSKDLAKTTVYWPGMDADVEDYVKRCPKCIKETSCHRETLRPHEVPPTAWYKLGADMFYLDGQKYLLIADYFSKYPFLFKINSENAKTITKCFDEVIAQEGKPAVLMTDNGPPFNSEAFAEFARSWDFKHITSSPHYHQSNGFIERMVQTVKKMLKKTKPGHVQKALLQLRSTPLGDGMPSPAEILHGRPAHGVLPSQASKPVDLQKVREILVKRQEQYKAHYDKRYRATDHRMLEEGEEVFYNKHGAENPTWLKGKIEQVLEDGRSYSVLTQSGRSLKRNRHHIKPLCPDGTSFLKNKSKVQPKLGPFRTTTPSKSEFSAFEGDETPADRPERLPNREQGVPETTRPSTRSQRALRRVTFADHPERYMYDYFDDAEPESTTPPPRRAELTVDVETPPRVIPPPNPERQTTPVMSPASAPVSASTTPVPSPNGTTTSPLAAESNQSTPMPSPEKICAEQAAVMQPVSPLPSPTMPTLDEFQQRWCSPDFKPDPTKKIDLSKISPGLTNMARALIAVTPTAEEVRRQDAEEPHRKRHPTPPPPEYVPKPRVGAKRRADPGTRSQPQRKVKIRPSSRASPPPRKVPRREESSPETPRDDVLATRERRERFNQAKRRFSIEKT